MTGYRAKSAHVHLKGKPCAACIANLERDPIRPPSSRVEELDDA